MRRALLLLGIFLIISASAQADSYSNCTPSCPTGYADNGLSCSGSTCTLNCTAWVCGSVWSLEYEDTTSLSIDTGNDEGNAQTSLYNTSNQSRCYNFTYQASGSLYVWLSVDNPGNCTGEMTAGFFDEGNTNSNPWFANMSSDYLGDTTCPPVSCNTFDYMYRTMRSYTNGDDCFNTGSCRENAVVNYSIYCAPNATACGELPESRCNSNCYNRRTKAYLWQSYSYDFEQGHDYNLYRNAVCGNQYVTSNKHQTPAFRIHSTALGLSSDYQTCQRPPSALSVSVLPLNATAGTDLTCNYTYHDWRNFSEQNTSYLWWKNGVNQNIDSRVLGKNNLSAGDSWRCAVVPSEGLLMGDTFMSANNVTILSTVANVTLYVQGNNTWNASGHYDAWDPVVFTSQLQAALDSCAADAQGYCNISLDFFSASNGTLNATTLTMYYETISAEPGIALSNLNEFSGNGTERLFEFTIENIGSTALSNANWTFYPGNGDAVNSTIGLNLSVGENASVYVAYNYSSVGLFTVTATARAAGLSSSQNITVEFPLQLRNLSTIYSSARERLFEFIIENTYGRLLPEVNFTVSRGDGSENSTYPLNLSAGESVSVYYYYNYSAAGNFTVNASATSGAYVSGENISVAVG